MSLRSYSVQAIFFAAVLSAGCTSSEPAAPTATNVPSQVEHKPPVAEPVNPESVPEPSAPTVVPKPEPAPKPAADLSGDMDTVQALKKLEVSCEQQPEGWKIELPYGAKVDPLLDMIQKLSLVKSFAGRDVTDAQFTKIVQLNGLQELTLSGENLTDAGLEPLSQAVNLKRLDLHRAEQITAMGLAHVAKLSHLEGFGLGSTSHHGELGPLDQLKQLKFLSIGSASLTDEDLACLASMPHLETLHLNINSGINGECLKNLAGATHLKQLWLPLTSVTDESLAPLANLTDLEDLHLGSEHITDAGLVHIAGLTKIKRLDLGGTHVAGPGLKHVSGMKQLERIEFGFLGFTGEGLQYLADKPGIKELYLGWCGITDDGCAELKKLQQLKKLTMPKYGYQGNDNEQAPWKTLHPEKLTDRGMKHLGDLVNLESLELAGGGITDSGLEALSNLKKLQYLTFGALPNVKGPGLEALKDLPELTDLTLERTGVDAEGLQHLNGLPKLGTLKLPRQVDGSALSHVYKLKSLRAVSIWKEVTKEQEEEFKRQLPNAYVRREIY